MRESKGERKREEMEVFVERKKKRVMKNMKRQENEEEKETVGNCWEK